jgi:predicted nucleotidyltransferase component of viral defense system
MTTADDIRNRLRKIASAENRQVDFLIIHYCIERLLYRLSVSPYADNFVLKGGLLLYSLLEERARATRDVDLLARRIQNLPETMEKVFTDIISIPVDDAVSFDTEGIIIERIKEDAEYEGIRVKFVAYLGKSRSTLQFDIGFGDAIVPAPVEMTYPSLLDMEPPHLKAYTIESVIAEKFQAAVFLSVANSRMKDFYDIYELSQSFDFDGATLYDAVKQTFGRRNTELPEMPTIFTEGFATIPDKQIQWQAFQRRVEVAHDIDFSKALSAIRVFLEPIYQAIYADTTFNGKWSKANQAWS